MKQLMTLDDMNIDTSHELGTQQFENWIVQVTVITFAVSCSRS